MSNYVLTGTYTLPSLGKVYEPAINKNIVQWSKTCNTFFPVFFLGDSP